MLLLLLLFQSLNNRCGTLCVFPPLVFSGGVVLWEQGTRIVLEGGVEPLEKGIEPGDLVFVLRETRHRTFRRLREDSPHLTADITVRGRFEGQTELRLLSSFLNKMKSKITQSPNSPNFDCWLKFIHPIYYVCICIYIYRFLTDV